MKAISALLALSALAHATQVTFTNDRRLLFDVDGNQVDAYGSKINCKSTLALEIFCANCGSLQWILLPIRQQLLNRRRRIRYQVLQLSRSGKLVRSLLGPIDGT